MNKNKDAIANVLARRVWDSRGRPTIEVEVHLAGGASGRAIAPAGASKGSGEAVDLRDGGPRFGGLDVTRAVAGVNDEIARILRGFNPHNQSQIDGALTALDGTPDRSRLGANAIVATSMAVAHAAAASRGMPLWQSLRAAPGAQLPLPEIQIFGGGAHAGRRVDIQDFMVIAVGATEYAQALEWTAEVYRAGGELLSESGRLSGVADEGGYWPAFDSNEQGLEMLLRAIERAGFVPGDEVAIALDVAASQFGRGGHYRLRRDGRELDSDGMTTEMTIRTAMPADAAAIAAIYNQGIAERIATFETEPRTAAQIAAQLTEKGDRFPSIAVECEGRIIAFAGAGPYRSRPCYAGVAEHSVYVDLRARGRGAGKAALEALIASYEARGFWKLLSRIFPENKASLALHVRPAGEAGIQGDRGRLPLGLADRFRFRAGDHR